MQDTHTARTATTLNEVRRARHLSQAALAELVGMTRQAVASRCVGATMMTVPDLHAFAEALNVEPRVLLMDRYDALRWMLDHDSDLQGRSAPWLSYAAA